MVFIESIFSSYSPKPLVIGSSVNDFNNAVPAFTALFVMLANAVAPIIPKAENLLVTVSTLLLNPFDPSVALPNQEPSLSKIPPKSILPIKPAIPLPTEDRVLPNLVQILSVLLTLFSSSKFNVDS